MSLETFTLLKKIRLNSSPEVELYSTVFWIRNCTPDPKTSLVHNGHVKTNSSQGLLWLREFREGSGAHRGHSVLMLSKLQTEETADALLNESSYRRKVEHMVNGILIEVFLESKYD